MNEQLLEVLTSISNSLYDISAALTIIMLVLIFQLIFKGVGIPGYLRDINESLERLGYRLDNIIEDRLKKGRRD